MKPSLILLALALPLHAGPSTSTNYSVTPATVDSGGGRSGSSNYTMDGSLGGIAGVSSAGTPLEVLKSGYVGQLYEVTALQLAAAPTTVDEEGSRQLSALATLDDATSLALDAGAVAWSVVAGPLAGIDAGGLATADKVYQDTPATAQGIWSGLTGTLGLTVLDTIPDNFGSYAGDGLGDAWQFDHFGPDNPLAGPHIDADGDGQDNLFELTAGLDPTNPLSRFLLEIRPVPGEPTHQDIVFSPRLPDRNYAVEMSTTLNPAWVPLGASSQIDAGDQRTVTDLEATPAKKFYRVEISKP
ncbi:MAG: hypothetical protein K9N23_19495 [Akkermansiaceae bacterium]|nr:hypothetical protein [Akkermansiaceae bacterium]